MLAEKALFTLADVLDEKARTRALEALEEVRGVVAEAEHTQQELKEGLAALTNYDSTFVNVSFSEGVRQIAERVNEYVKELQMTRVLYERQDDVITACKVALVESVTADHRWHPPEERCPHTRCVALNKIEAVRGQ